ncbi:hypothetical protein TNCV_2969271 [Trichonephila clavipes]|nr:hypothetical protein TNCV_2969271 [Trichonephila clavipes]
MEFFFFPSFHSTNRLGGKNPDLPRKEWARPIAAGEEVGTNILQRTIDKYSACVEVGKPIDENSACVEIVAGTTISRYYLRRGEISGIEIFLHWIHRTCEQQGSQKKKSRIFPNFYKMYKNALKEDFIRVVEKLDGTVESTDTIVKLKTKIENSSTFESDPDSVKTLIQNCIDERVSRNEREVTSGKQKIELAKLQLAQLEKEVELQRVKNKALSLNPAAKVEEKQFETLNKETATHIGIREAEDWFRPIDLAKECDIYISSKNGSHKETPITYGYPRPL